MFDQIKGFIDACWKIVSDPMGFLSELACSFINMIFGFLPSTPHQFTLSGMADEIGGKMSFIGSGIVYEVLRNFALLLGLVVLIKIYKLIPFKMT